MNRLHLVWPLVLLLAVPGVSQNLLPNSQFDTDIAGWQGSFRSSWSTADSNGFPDSGSARITAGSFPTSGYYGPSVCLAIEEGEKYLASLQAYVPAGQSRRGGAWYEFGFHSNLDCDGSRMTGGVILVDETGTWTRGQRVIQAPEGASAIRVSLANYTFDGGEDDHLVYIDDVSLERFTLNCIEDDETLCLSDGRFAVQASWRTNQGTSGEGGATMLSDDTGLFWFFDEANTEVVIKVLDTCSFTDRFWVFAGGLTNVEVELRVTDTSTDTVRVYRNELGDAFQPVQDTDAFATCP